MKRTLLSSLIALAGLFILVSGAQAYQFYSEDIGTTGGCAQCHGAFRSGKYVSPTDGEAWGVHLHAGHLNNTDVGANCSNCHDGAGVSGRTVNLSSSGNAADGVNALSCSGCHGRVEDGALGAGLRLHHINAGAPADSQGLTCNSCHNDPAPVGENVMPAWYATFSLNPCNVNGGEDFTGNGLGNDNDGDLDYDGADSDCGAPPVCGDGTVDTGEACDDGGANGTTTCGCQTDCTLPAAGTSCADGAYCNGDETCDGAGSCQPGTPVVCDDGVGCTVDSCDEVNDTCENAPDNASCDDGLFCTGSETCDPNNDCVSQGDPCAAGTTCNEATDTCDQPTGECGDGVIDTGETCDDGTANGTTTCGCQTDCTLPAAGTSCADTAYCNGAETCDGAGACQAGTPVDCSDGVGCTDDSCDEAADACVNTINDANCPDDGAYCNGAEYCDAANDCSSTGDPCLTGTTCNETTDTCDAATCVDYSDKGTCQMDPACAWYGKGNSGYCDDAPPPGDCSALGRKDCKADANCSWIDNTCVDYVPPTCSDFTKKNTCTANGCTWDQSTGTCS